MGESGQWPCGYSLSQRAGSEVLLPPAGDLMVIDDPLVALGAKGQQLTASPGHSPHQENMNKCVAAKAAGGVVVGEIPFPHLHHRGKFLPFFCLFVCLIGKLKKNAVLGF